MNKNCPNCGAPYDVNLNKCPYCGTSYFDMSAIDFENEEYFYLKIKINGMIVTQLVKPRVNDMVVEHENTYITGRNGATITAHNTGSRATTNISFEAVPDKKNNNTLIMIKKED